MSWKSVAAAAGPGRMSTKTYGHLHEEDRAWFIADSFQWLVD